MIRPRKPAKPLKTHGLAIVTNAKKTIKHIAWEKKGYTWQGADHAKAPAGKLASNAYL